MATVAPSSTVSLHEPKCEIHFAVSGFWDPESMQGFLEKLNQAALPLMKARKPIYALGEFDGFVPQNRETGEAIQVHLSQAVKFGLRRIAIVNAAPLAKMQYKRLAKDVTVEFFSDKGEAIAWLRGVN